MLTERYELACDICGKKQDFKAGELPHRWNEVHEMANGEGSEKPIYMFGGIPLIPKRHICPACSDKLFGDESVREGLLK